MPLALCASEPRSFGSGMMIVRVALTAVLSLGLLATPLIADSPQPPKIPRIGWLSIAALTPEVSHLIEAFSQGLRERGYVEGQTLAIEYRFAEGKPERLPGLAAELIRLKVDIIVTPNPAGAQAAKQATKSIPIVMLYVADPVRSGLVASLAKPGGNITGLAASTGVETTGKLVELLGELVPNVRLVALLRNPGNPDAAEMSSEAARVARVLGLQLRMLDARAPNELDSAFASMTKARAGALLLIADTMFFLHRGQVAHLATKSRLPTISASSEMAEAGLLMSYGPNLAHGFRHAADYVDKILKGAKPADLPVEQPTKYDLVINLKTAKALGLTIPPSLLLRANRVVE